MEGAENSLHKSQTPTHKGAVQEMCINNSLKNLLERVDNMPETTLLSLS